MMPTTFAGIVLYIFSLFPGIAFLFAREGHKPTAKRSVLRETATILFVSTVCDVAVVLVVVVASIWLPSGDLIRDALRGDASWFIDHFPIVAILIVLILTVATLLGFALGTKRADRWGLGRLWNSEIPRDQSAWGAVLSADGATEVVVGITLTSGAWVGGLLYAFDNSPEPSPGRAITLAGKLRYRAPGAMSDVALAETDYLVIEAREISTLQVTHRNARRAA